MAAAMEGTATAVGAEGTAGVLPAELQQAEEAQQSPLAPQQATGVPGAGATSPSAEPQQAVQQAPLAHLHSERQPDEQQQQQPDQQPDQQQQQQQQEQQQQQPDQQPDQQQQQQQEQQQAESSGADDDAGEDGEATEGGEEGDAGELAEDDADSPEEGLEGRQASGGQQAAPEAPPPPSQLPPPPGQAAAGQMTSDGVVMPRPGRIGPVCRVPGCKDALKHAYSQRHRICPHHYKATAFTMGNGSTGQWRFCQQCAKPHPLDHFDDARRSCRESLQKHKKRRQQPGGRRLSAGALAAGSTPMAGYFAPGSNLDITALPQLQPSGSSAFLPGLAGSEAAGAERGRKRARRAAASGAAAATAAAMAAAVGYDAEDGGLQASSDDSEGPPGSRARKMKRAGSGAVAAAAAAGADPRESKLPLGQALGQQQQAQEAGWGRQVAAAVARQQQAQAQQAGEPSASLLPITQPPLPMPPYQAHQPPQSPASSSVLELHIVVATLQRRVAELERRVDELQSEQQQRGRQAAPLLSASLRQMEEQALAAQHAQRQEAAAQLMRELAQASEQPRHAPAAGPEAQGALQQQAVQQYPGVAFERYAGQHASGTAGDMQQQQQQQQPAPQGGQQEELLSALQRLARELGLAHETQQAQQEAQQPAQQAQARQAQQLPGGLGWLLPGPSQAQQQQAQRQQQAQPQQQQGAARRNVVMAPMSTVVPDAEALLAAAVAASRQAASRRAGAGTGAGGGGGSQPAGPKDATPPPTALASSETLAMLLQQAVGTRAGAANAGASQAPLHGELGGRRGSGGDGGDSTGNLLPVGAQAGGSGGGCPGEGLAAAEGAALPLPGLPHNNMPHALASLLLLGSSLLSGSGRPAA